MNDQQVTLTEHKTDLHNTASGAALANKQTNTHILAETQPTAFANEYVKIPQAVSRPDNNNTSNSRLHNSTTSFEHASNERDEITAADGLKNKVSPQGVTDVDVIQSKAKKDAADITVHNLIPAKVPETTLARPSIQQEQTISSEPELRSPEKLPVLDAIPLAGQIHFINPVSTAPVLSKTGPKMQLYAGLGAFANLNGSYTGLVVAPDFRWPAGKKLAFTAEPFIGLRVTSRAQLVRESFTSDVSYESNNGPIQNAETFPTLLNVKTNPLTLDGGLRVGLDLLVLSRLSVYGGLQYRLNNMTGREGLRSYKIADPSHQEQLSIAPPKSPYHSIGIGAGLGYQFSARWQVRSRLWYIPATSGRSHLWEGGLTLGYRVFW